MSNPTSQLGHERIRIGTALANDVEQAKSRRALGRAVSAFLEFLSAVPDQGPHNMTAADVAVLSQLVENVIQRIEAHIDSHHDSLAKQSELGMFVYRLRAGFEQVDQWHRRVGH